eukprot:6691332-Pyramimonas_sp.AAC.1
MILIINIAVIIINIFNFTNIEYASFGGKLCFSAQAQNSDEGMIHVCARTMTQVWPSDSDL